MNTPNNVNQKSYSIINIFFLILAPIIAVILTLLFSLNLFAATLLYFGPPALYISWKRKDIVLRSLIYSMTITVISILTDYLAERDQSWVSTTVFTFRIAEVVPIEALVWLFVFTYLIVAYYQFFYDSATHKAVGKRMPYVFFAAIAVLVWICLTAMFDLHFTIDFYYIKFGILFLVLPLLVFIISFPQYVPIFLKISPYFFALGLVNLLVSLDQGHWSYPGIHFVGWVELGSYRFPIEELIFWIILYPSFLISQFELFNNDLLDVRPQWITKFKPTRLNR